MKIGEQFRHLLLGKATGKTWHHSLASEHHAAHFGIGCRSPARQRGPFEDSMQVGWNLLESQIVVIVAVRTPDGVEMLAIGLLYSEGRGRLASRQQCSACTIPNPAATQTQSRERVFSWTTSTSR